MNNTIFENIITRRSVRSFTDQPIRKEILEKIMEAAIYAPSGKNMQSWHFTVLQKKELIDKLAGVIAQALNIDEKHYDFYHPDVLILASNDRDNYNGNNDCACSLQNIFLMSHAMGIGSVWINQLRTICDVPEVREVLRELKVPENHIVWGMAALGYPADVPKAKPRKEGTIHYILS